MTKRRQKIVEAIALDDHVAAHCLFGGPVVTGPDCSNHSIVLSKGADHAIADLKLHAPIGLQDGVQPRRFLRKECIVRRTIDAGMEGRVLGVVGVDFALIGQPPAGLVRGFEFRNVLQNDAWHVAQCADPGRCAEYH